MFGIGFWETVVIILAIVIFIKPRDLPLFAGKLGKLFGEIRATYDMFMRNLRENGHPRQKEMETDITPLPAKNNAIMRSRSIPSPYSEVRGKSASGKKSKQIKMKLDKRRRYK